MKILIIDNDINTVTTLKALILSREAFDIDVAYGGKEGLEKMTANPNYNLLILDIMMPGVSGMDVCRAMSKDEKMKNIPVLLVSALPIASKELRELLDQFNETHVVGGVLEKPFEIENLLGEVHRLAKVSS
ncbi:MAG: response regulator [Patescibacteria group bacterium]|jgi:CheY-like chemotaxis protein